MKVRVAVHGRFHAFALAMGLDKLGALEKLQTTFPTFAARRVIGPDIAIDSATGLELARRIGQSFGLHDRIDPWVARRFASFVADRLEPCTASILVGWSSALLEAIGPAHDRGLKVVLERGSTHIDHQTEALCLAYEKAGLRPRTAPEDIVRRERAEYAAADLICVPSAIAARSFVDRGVSADKVFVNHLGVDLDEFTGAERAKSAGPVRIVCVGEVGVRKGSLDLIDAVQELDGAATVAFVGQIEPDFRAALATRELTGVEFAGPLARTSVHQAYRDADIFCLPSIEEGFGMAVLEAMASGLPVVISDQVGAADIVEHEVSGVVTPVQDHAALAAALNTLVVEGEKRIEMGRRARQAVEALTGWDAYAARAFARYQQLLSI